MSVSVPLAPPALAVVPCGGAVGVPVRVSSPVHILLIWNRLDVGLASLEPLVGSIGDDEPISATVEEVVPNPIDIEWVNGKGRMDRRG